ncbi:TetR family transcriptional regulator [Streptomyces sp. M19]
MTAASFRFAKYGYDGTSVRDIAKDVGVDATLVYRYFGSKRRCSRRWRPATRSNRSWTSPGVRSAVVLRADHRRAQDG